ncbi:hypothetical protein TcasGA2_TC007166 [Tribolium castaneum]|uniref:Uncharacterized protein n=1 Tax=Tribolium castaneum TaxID=7070 RepID=D2A107_TRICA|nr:hypothetical protein TcasGA2_TC007166 [Tribolium castaneum]
MPNKPVINASGAPNDHSKARESLFRVRAANTPCRQRSVANCRSRFGIVRPESLRRSARVWIGGESAPRPMGIKNNAQIIYFFTWFFRNSPCFTDSSDESELTSSQITALNLIRQDRCRARVICGSSLSEEQFVHADFLVGGGGGGGPHKVEITRDAVAPVAQSIVPYYEDKGENVRNTTIIRPLLKTSSFQRSQIKIKK